MNACRLIVLTASLFIAGAGAAQLTAAPKAAAPTPKATAPITATLTGLGCATSLGADTFEARSWSWGATNTATDAGSGGGSGKAVISALTLSRVSDACSPDLLGAVVTGKHFPTFTLSQFDKDGVLKSTVLLTDAIVTSWQVGGTNTSAEALEDVQVSFRKLTFTDVASGNKFSWDLFASKPF
jgi:type VI protein secretion system component Hcp